jgi:hypothetical protein
MAHFGKKPFVAHSRDLVWHETNAREDAACFRRMRRQLNARNERTIWQRINDWLQSDVRNPFASR